MGTDICIAVLGRKERDMDYSESMYRAVLLWKKEGGGKKKDFCPFYFPYFRNSLLFDWMKTNLLHDGRWNGTQKNIENPDAVKWYFDKKNEDGLRGHSYMTLKEVKKPSANSNLKSRTPKIPRIPTNLRQRARPKTLNRACAISTTRPSSCLRPTN